MSGRQAFLTGSRVYGTPREDSDIDLVVPVSPETAARIIELAGEEAQPQGYEGTQSSVRFGDLNLLLVCSDAMYEAWRAGTDKLKAEAPVTRERAISVLYDERRTRDAHSDELECRRAALAGKFPVGPVAGGGA